MTEYGGAALDDEDEDGLFAYEYDDDYPESLLDLGSVLLGGRPLNSKHGPMQQIRVLATAGEYRERTVRRAGKGKAAPQTDFEKEMEYQARLSAQKAVSRVIVPKVKAESADAFIRRLDAHRQAPEALIPPLTPPEDEVVFTKRMIAVKANENPNVVILPKTARESNQEFEERLALAGKTACVLSKLFGPSMHSARRRAN